MAVTSTKIIIGFVVLFAGVYGGKSVYSKYRVSQLKLNDIKPEAVNLVGIDLARGYKIIVSNQMAQLIEVNPNSSGSSDVGNEEMSGAAKKRVPIKELLQSLQGNSDALGKFIMTMNDLREDDLPPVRVVWKAEDLEKACKGDKVLEEKLEKDLNMRLDGTPLPVLKFSSLENGIVIDIPVKVEVMRDGKPDPLVGRVQIAYKPTFIKAVEEQYRTNANAGRTTQLGAYDRMCREFKPGSGENIRQNLLNRISDTSKASYAEKPESILKSARVIVNSSLITSATVKDGVKQDKRVFYTLNIDLNSEGADRLWKYSMDNLGSQLLLVQNGMAIAAPRVSQELGQQNLEITQIPDHDLVYETADIINKKKQ